MLYFKKNNNMYYRLDPTTITVHEVFIGTTQVRIMALTENQAFYDETYQRIQTAQFVEGTAQEFEAFLAFAVGRITS